MNVEWSRENAQALRQTGAALDAEVAELIERTLADPGDSRKEGDPYQVFLLTPNDDPQTLTLAHAIEHQTRGRGSGWTRGTRYTSEDALRRTPQTAEDL